MGASNSCLGNTRKGDQSCLDFSHSIWQKWRQVFGPYCDWWQDIWTHIKHQKPSTSQWNGIILSIKSKKFKQTQHTENDGDCVLELNGCPFDWFYAKRRDKKPRGLLYRRNNVACCRSADFLGGNHFENDNEVKDVVTDWIKNLAAAEYNEIIPWLLISVWICVDTM